MLRLILAVFLAVLTFSANAANKADLSWGAVTNYSDGAVIPSTVTVTYSIYQGVKGAPKAKLSTTTSTTASVTSGLSSGTEFCWQVSATTNGMEGALSNEACKAFPAVAPEAPTGLSAK